jgi:PncC family amidohydrolase
MAVGARNKTGATYALSVTGVAGPAGGTESKPVGLVYFGLATPQGTTVLKKRFAGDREQIRAWATIQGLDMIRRAVQGFSNS